MAFHAGTAPPMMGTKVLKITATIGAGMGSVGGAEGKPTPEKSFALDHKHHKESDAPPHAAPSAASNHTVRMGANASMANALPKARRINVGRSFNMLPEDSGYKQHHPEYLVRW